MPGADWNEMADPCDYAALIGPINARQVDDRPVFGLRVEQKHCNSAGIMHGGALCGFIDEVVGNTVIARRGGRHVTVQLSTVFLRAIMPGDFLEPDIVIVEATRSMTFLEAKLRVGDKVVASASLIFKALRVA